MQLSKNILTQITTVEIPQHSYFALPEKIIQFGTGVLLRGLPDYYVDKSNKQGVFNGRIVVVKSTGNNDTGEFDKQDCLYTQCIFGIEDGKQVTQHIINASISRVLPATASWQQILECAGNAEMEIVISNTTEVGITYKEELIGNATPVSFPGKLLAFLLHRFQVFNGATDKGMVIIPTELIIDNGVKLKEILLKLSAYNELSVSFVEWLKHSNTFCNSLVDRIVPGKPSDAFQKQLAKTLGYDDNLVIISEPYSLWAIETNNIKVKDILSFSSCDKHIVITDNIAVHRELKLRLLNGSHTFSCGLAHLAGFTTVDEAMNDVDFFAYIKQLMLDEIAPAIQNDNLGKNEKEAFVLNVLDRFRNPYVGHKWMSITLQYTSKMALRNVPVILNYIKHFNKVPAHMALGFAAHILFMKCSIETDGRYYGKSKGETYLVNDSHAERYALIWRKENEPLAVVTSVLANNDVWGFNLNTLPGFTTAVTYYVTRLMEYSVHVLLKEVQNEKVSV